MYYCGWCWSRSSIVGEMGVANFFSEPFAKVRGGVPAVNDLEMATQ